MPSSIPAFKSAPEQKALSPTPVITITLTDESTEDTSTASVISFIKAVLRALYTCGRLSVMVETPSTISKTIFSYIITINYLVLLYVIIFEVLPQIYSKKA